MSKGVEDSVMSVWTMPSGAMVYSHESFTHGFAETGIEFHGSEGSIFASNVMTQQPIGAIRLIHGKGETRIPFETHNLYHHSLQLFTDAAAGKGRPAADGVDGVKSLALAVRNAARSGRAVQVNYGGI